MGDWVKVKAEDGHELGAYVASPAQKPIGALVVVQEIFGVNEHIRSVADGYARDGFLAIVPALFDRIERDLQLDYSPEGKKKAFSLYPQLSPELSLQDVAAAFAHVKGADRAVGVLGFCYGGLMSWLSATRGEKLKMQPGCCVGYYAGGIGKFAAEEPVCPVLLHFGANDSHIGKDQIEAVRAAHPEVEIHMYEGAGHAFNRDPDPDAYHAPAAKLARERSLEFLKKNLA